MRTSLQHMLGAAAAAAAATCAATTTHLGRCGCSAGLEYSMTGTSSVEILLEQLCKMVLCLHCRWAIPQCTVEVSPMPHPSQLPARATLGCPLQAQFGCCKKRSNTSSQPPSQRHSACTHGSELWPCTHSKVSCCASLAGKAEALRRAIACAADKAA